MEFQFKMIVSRLGISVTYRCQYLRKPFEPKCAHRETDKCHTCKYGVATLLAADATKLLDLYCGEIMSRGKDFNEREQRKTIRGYHPPRF